MTFGHGAENLHARIINQHDPGGFQSLPRFPGYLDRLRELGWAARLPHIVRVVREL